MATVALSQEYLNLTIGAGNSRFDGWSTVHKRSISVAVKPLLFAHSKDEVITVSGELGEDEIQIKSLKRVLLQNRQVILSS